MFTEKYFYVIIALQTIFYDKSHADIHKKTPVGAR